MATGSTDGSTDDSTDGSTDVIRCRGGRAVGLVGCMTVTALLGTPRAGASAVTETTFKMFVQQGSNDPIVSLAALDGFDQPDGSLLDGLATPAGGGWTAGQGSLAVHGSAARREVPLVSTAVLGLAVGDVQVGAEIRSDDGAPASGVVLHSGPDGELRVLFVADGADRRLELVLVEGAVVTRLASGAPVAGPIIRAVIRVESRRSVITAWVDGVAAFTETLQGHAAVIGSQTDQGIVVGRDEDAVDDVRVLALS